MFNFPLSFVHPFKWSPVLPMMMILQNCTYYQIFPWWIITNVRGKPWVVFMKCLSIDDEPCLVICIEGLFVLTLICPHNLNAYGLCLQEESILVTKHEVESYPATWSWTGNRRFWRAKLEHWSFMLWDIIHRLYTSFHL